MQEKDVLNIEEKNLKELEYVLPMELQTGENLIEVKIYNSNNIYPFLSLLSKSAESFCTL